jgi:hypothetical protein
VIKMRFILCIIAIDFLLGLLLIACGSNSSSGGTSTNAPTPTTDQAAGVMPSPTQTIDQATPSPTIDQAQATPTPPTPIITPTQLNPGTCTLTGTGWDCSVILSGQIPLYWSVTSPDLPAADITYNPSSGMLSADNQYQQKVTISIVSVDCQSGTGGTFVFSFSGGAREARVSWSCS